MGRKKKVVEDVSAPIYYTGEVTIKLVDKKGKVRKVSKHNTGQIGLFTFLALSLQGSSNMRHRPQLLMAYTDTQCSDAVFTSKVPYTDTPQLFYGGTKVQFGSDCNGVMFTFSIPFSSVISGKNKIRSLQLFNDLTNPKVCAKVVLANDENLDNGSNIVVYWKMLFSSSQA